MLMFSTQLLSLDALFASPEGSSPSANILRPCKQTTRLLCGDWVPHWLLHSSCVLPGCKSAELSLLQVTRGIREPLLGGTACRMASDALLPEQEASFACQMFALWDLFPAKVPCSCPRRIELRPPSHWSRDSGFLTGPFPPRERRAQSFPRAAYGRAFGLCHFISFERIFLSGEQSFQEALLQRKRLLLFLR